MISHSPAEASTAEGKAKQSTSFGRIAAAVLWVIGLAILIRRSAGGHHHTIAFEHFRLAGVHWIHGEGLYADWRGFVYSPFAALFFTPFAFIPPSVGVALWQILNAAALLIGMGLFIRTLSSGSVRKHEGLAFILVLPWALGNLDIGHSNPLLIGLIMAGVAFARRESWWCAALCLALATHLKIYPVAIGMLLCVYAPSRFTWRFVVSVALLGIIPFACQHGTYVAGQYHDWIVTRSADNRLNYPIEYAPLDLWLLLHWLGHLQFPHWLYTAVQLLGAGGVALFCFLGRRKGWAPDRILNGLFFLGTLWMILLGPSTESYTYLLLAPAVILLLLHAFAQPASLLLRLSVVAAFLLQLAAVARSSLLPHFNPLWTLGVQPFGAIVFLLPCLVWLLDDAAWDPNQSNRSS